MGKRRVLIVVSAYKPAMIADMQRARMLAWELPKLEWDVEILTPHLKEIRQDVVEPVADGFFAPGTRVHEVGATGGRLFSAVGLRSHVWRTIWSIRLKGDKLLRSKRFDVVYFTTTSFLYVSLGPRWTRKFGVPYVADFHDPWVKEAGKARPSEDWRSQLLQCLNMRLERATVVNAAGIVAVSPRYIEMLRQRYSGGNPVWLDRARNEVIPFGALESDLREAAKFGKGPCRVSDEISIHYVGAGGLIMLRSMELICRAAAALRGQGDPLIDRMRVRLFGTTYNWKPGDPKLLEFLAIEAGLAGLVEEWPERVSYRRSLELMLESDGVLVLGVDDPGYMPSKLFSYALSGKPMFASLRRDGPAYAEFKESGKLGRAIWFDHSGEMPTDDAAKALSEFLQESALRQTFDRREMLAPFLAPAMSRRHARLFEACLESERV